MVAEQLESLARNNSKSHVVPPPPANERQVLRHFLFVAARLDQGDVDGTAA